MRLSIYICKNHTLIIIVMKKIILRAITFSLFFIAFCSCSSDESSSSAGRKSIVLSAENRAIVANYADFSYDFFRAVDSETDDDKNIIVSPWSAVNLMSMTGNCGDYTAQQSITKILGVSDFDDLNAINKHLYEELTTLTKDVALQSYRSVWQQKDCSAISQTAKKILQNDYFADVATFNSADQLKTSINSWINKKSKGEITSIKNNATEETVVSFVDLMSFNGKWRNKFDIKDSHKGVFHNVDGTQSTVTMMNAKNSIEWFKHDFFDAVWLDFGKGEFSMIVMLPNDEASVSSVIECLNSHAFENFNSNENYEAGKYGKNKVPVSFPKFDVDAEYNLERLFAKLGLSNKWRDDGDNLNINFLQKSRIRVDEEGAVATTVTVSNGYTDVDFAEGEPFVVDRPFVYIIKENSTGVILQMGKISQL